MPNNPGLHTPGTLSTLYMAAIKKNTLAILDARGMSTNQFAKELKNHNMVDVKAGNLNKYLNTNEKIPFGLILKISEFLNVPISDLIDENLDINHVIDNLPSYESDTSPIIDQPVPGNDILVNSATLHLGPFFVTDVTSKAFKELLQTFYCYFYPTVSNEDQLLQATLTLRPKGTICEALFTMQTNEEIPATKEYSGFAVVSLQKDAVYVILTGYGEISVLNFRLVKTNNNKMDCRIAEVLTNCAGEDRYPTAHRMILSRQEIKQEDFPLLASHLLLNNNHIIVSADRLNSLSSKNELYKKLLDHETDLLDPIPVYKIAEADISSTARKLRISKSDCLSLLLEMRDEQFSYRYTKVSKKADNNLRSNLLSRGYYKQRAET